jgi:Exonuclease III
MAYQKKRHYLESYDAGIKVIIECSESSLASSTDLWFGDSSYKGIGVEFKSNIVHSIAPYYSPEYKWVIPIEVRANGYDFTLFAVWLKLDKKLAYAGSFIQAMKYYLPVVAESNVMIIGDFNSNSIWDNKHVQHGNHSALVNMLEEAGIVSTYHRFYNEKQGRESRFTHFYRRSAEALFHIDYCFMSHPLYRSLEHYEVGEVSDWIDKSDHAPLILSLETKEE